jgi:hypothetical protein
MRESMKYTVTDMVSGAAISISNIHWFTFSFVSSPRFWTIWNRKSESKFQKTWRQLIFKDGQPQQNESQVYNFFEHFTWQSSAQRWTVSSTSMHSWLSMSSGFPSMESINWIYIYPHTYVYIYLYIKYNCIHIEHIQTVFLVSIPYTVQYNNYFCSIYIVLDVMKNLRVI